MAIIGVTLARSHTLVVTERNNSGNRRVVAIMWSKLVTRFRTPSSASTVLPTPASTASGAPLDTFDTIEVPRGRDLVRNLTQAHLRAIVREMAPLVQTHPGYRDLDLDHLNLEVVDSPTLFARIAGDIAHSRGVAALDGVDQPATVTLPVAPMGLYIYSTKTISVSRDRAARISWDTLRSVVFHELMHRGQDVKFPAFREGINTLVQDLAGLDADAPKAKEIQKALDSRMTLAEGEAIFWQNKLLASHFKGYRDEDAERVRAATTLSKAYKEKMDQYLNGYVFFKEFEQKRVPYAFVDAAFEQPALADKHLVDFNAILSLSRSKDRRKKPPGKMARKVSPLLFTPSNLPSL